MGCLVNTINSNNKISRSTGYHTTHTHTSVIPKLLHHTPVTNYYTLPFFVPFLFINSCVLVVFPHMMFSICPSVTSEMTLNNSASFFFKFPVIQEKNAQYF